jgi:hypothetical protein
MPRIFSGSMTTSVLLFGQLYLAPTQGARVVVEI